MKWLVLYLFVSASVYFSGVLARSGDTRMVLGFLPPNGTVVAGVAEEDPAYITLESWRNPTDWAEKLLDSPEAGQFVSVWVSKSPGSTDHRIKDCALLLQDEHSLKLNPIGPNILEVRLRNIEFQTGKPICFALLDYLRQTAREEEESMLHPASRGEETHRTRDQVSQDESQLIQSAQSSSGAQAMSRLSGRYQRDFHQLLERHAQEDHWASEVLTRAPQWNLLQGPEPEPPVSDWKPRVLACLWLFCTAYLLAKVSKKA